MSSDHTKTELSNDADAAMAAQATSGGRGLRPSEIDAARAQFDAARQRQKQLIMSGRLPPASHDGQSTLKSLPGYTIAREIHRGGQGVVYLAVQNSTGRQVAIKLLNHELPTAAGSAGLARFEREIEILSQLKHPNIVTVHDCGRDHGHVFLVMDYVVGSSLDVWAGRERADVAETLDLFAKICDGVNAAHLHGVIHRDLKPGNILVDERGVPHVLDFGLAKLVEESDEAIVAMTITGQFVGSLPWASPEQAEGRTDPGALDIRTDVYSLGVILYQLLTGRFPYPVSGRMSDVIRNICESEPTRPSTLDRTINRELETIVLKCLAKPAERRYQNAGDLARDIRRYLAGEAIEARRDSLVYLMSKRLARYRVAAIVAGAVLGVVLIALGFSLAYWRQAREQRIIAVGNADAAMKSAERADREAAQARAVFEFMRDILTSVEPQNQGAAVRLIEVLESASVQVSRRFGGHPQQEAEVRAMLGQVYDRLSMWAESRAQFAHASTLWRDIAGPDDPRTLATESLHITALLNLEQIDVAETHLGDLLPRLVRVFGPDDLRTLEAQRSLAFCHILRNRLDEAERVLLDLRARAVLQNEDQMQVRILAAMINVHLRRWSMAEQEHLQGILAAAEVLARERVERSLRCSGANSTTTLHAQAQLADLQCGLGQYDDAVDTCRRLLDRPYERLGECHHIRTSALNTLANALTRQGDAGEAADLQLRRLECVRKQFADASPALFLGALFDTLRYVDRGARIVEGELLARELTDALRVHGGGHDDMLVASEMYVAHFTSRQGRLDEAEPMFRSMLQGEPSILDSRVRSRLHLFFASHLTRRGEFELAESHLNLAAELVDDICIGTWETHPDDIVLGYLALYEAWDRPDQRAEYATMCGALTASH